MRTERALLVMHLTMIYVVRMFEECLQIICRTTSPSVTNRGNLYEKCHVIETELFEQL